MKPLPPAARSCFESFQPSWVPLCHRSSKEMSVNTPPQMPPLSKEAPPPRQRRLPAAAKAVTAAVASAAIAFTGLPAAHADTALPPVGSGFKFDFGPGTTADG